MPFYSFQSVSKSYSPIIALGEGWAYFMGRFLADRRYQVNQVSNASPCVEQGITYFNNFPVSGLSSHLNLLEDFNPNRLNDPFHWIPQGLFYDLMDNRNDRNFNASAVVDNVAGFSVQQINNTLMSDVKSLPQQLARMQQQNQGNQINQLNELYAEYHY